MNINKKIVEMATSPRPFRSIPTATVCESLNMLMDELRARGTPVRDFDNKDKTVQGIQIIKGEVYFLAAKERDH